MTCRSSQKCLVHLIRDLNDELFKNPFDEEYKALVAAFGALLRTIIETIDRYGLKKKNLHKHIKDTDKFYDLYIQKTFTSELTTKCAKRLKKCWTNLWLFLTFAAVPWNNNNAEVAIKAFAQHWRGIKGQMKEVGLSLYLEMLTLSQTCRYRNLSFLNLLRKKHGIWENMPKNRLSDFLPFQQAKLYINKLGFKRKAD
jgi:hypothetical protein